MNRQLLICFLVIIGCVVMTTFGRSNSEHRIAIGPWGGTGVHLEVDEKSARVEFDCAHGTMQGPLDLDSKGEFKLKGTFTAERGGPIRNDQESSGSAAIYSGSINGETMKLEIRIEGQDQPLNSYVLTQGKSGRLRKCL